MGKAKQDGTPRPIIIKFSSYRVRRQFYSARGLLKERNHRLRDDKAEASSPDDAARASESEVTGPPTESDAPDDPASTTPPRRPGSRIHLRHQNESHQDNHEENSDSPITIDSKFPVYINEALSKGRSKLCFEARKLKRFNKIADVWTYDGRVRIKDNYNRIQSIEKLSDLDKYHS